MKKQMILLTAIASMLLGCHGVIRDDATYRTEVGFMGAAASQETESLLLMIKVGCQCVNGKFVVPQCEQAAHRALVVQSRVPWHLSMMLYNARLDDTRPAVDPPAVPSPSTLCQ